MTLQNLYEEYTKVTPGIFSHRVLATRGGNADRVKFQKINCDGNEIICLRTLEGSDRQKTGFIKLFVHSLTHEIRYEVYRECIKSCYSVDLSGSPDIYNDLIERIA